jgi:hypothetical protein
VVWAAGPVAHTGRAFGAVAVGPSFRGGPRDLESLCGLRDRQAFLDDQLGQDEPMLLGQWGVSVDLSVTLSGPPMRW